MKKRGNRVGPSASVAKLVKSYQNHFNYVLTSSYACHYQIFIIKTNYGEQYISTESKYFESITS